LSVHAEAIVTAGLRPELFGGRGVLANSKTLVFAALIVLVVAGFGFRVTGLSAEGLSEDELNKLNAVADYRAHGLTGANGEHPMLMKACQAASIILAEKWNNTFVNNQIAPETALRLPGAIVGALRTAGVSRLGILSAAVLFPGEGLQYAFFKWLLRHHARDLEALETVVKASDLEWTIVRPPRLVKAPDARYLAERDALPQGPAATFTATFRGVAAFLLDAIEAHSHVRETVGLVRPR